jgi:cytoskeletal protein RodZ
VLDIGNTLRTERERRGLTIDDAAEATRIRATLLAAIEAEEFDRLPGPTYARGFLRSYAELLGLDPQPLVDEFNVRYAAAPWELDDEVMFPRRRGPRGTRGGRESGIVVVALAGILAVAVLVVIASTYPSTREAPLGTATSVVTVTEAAVNPVATAVTAQTAPDSTSAAAQAVVFVRALEETTITVRALGAPASTAPLLQRDVVPDDAHPEGVRLPRSASGYLLRLNRPGTVTLVVNGSPVVPGPTDTLLSIDPNGRVAAVEG